MTLKDMKVKKEKLEKDLLNLINDFENDTRLCVQCIDTDVVNPESNGHGYTKDVSLIIIL